MPNISSYFAFAFPIASLFISLPAAANPSAPLAPTLTEQIREIIEEKADRADWGQKLDSGLYYAVREDEGDPVVSGLELLPADLELDASGAALVDLTAAPGSALAAAISQAGGLIVSENANGNRVRLWLALANVESLARHPDVRWMQPASQSLNRAIDVSEGDQAHRTDLLRANFPVDGTGVTVGVLSDGVDALADLVASDDLPAGVAILEGQAGSGSEGTAMLEIVHDLAPGASLLFASATAGNKFDFAENIRRLREAGADVIVDDVAFFDEAVFQDDVVAEAVDEVTAEGALYFSSAGNSGRLDAGTAGVWEGDFVDSGAAVGEAPAHLFAPGEVSNQITLDSPFVYTLQWAEPQGAAASDYDLLLVDAGLTQVLAASTNVQDGTQNPFELIDSRFRDDAGARLLVIKNSGADLFIQVNTFRGRLAIGTAGQTSGHAAARGAIGVAAVDVRLAGLGAFDGSETIQSFSSDGARRVFFEADGTPITQDNFSATGGELRPKPDMAAADCVSTATPGFETFCGTSAAAPHAAAIAALLLELRPDLAQDPPALLETLRISAFDLGGDGFDRNAGSGLIDAVAASEVPEPSSTLMLFAGILMLARIAGHRGLQTSWNQPSALGEQSKTSPE